MAMAPKYAADTNAGVASHPEVRPSVPELGGATMTPLAISSGVPKHPADTRHNERVPRGRPRTFDVDIALDQALDIFSRQGYDATSIAQLTATMGLTPPQLYSAFGSKRELFDRVVERYGEHRKDYVDDFVAQPTARRVAQHYLEGAAEHDTRPGRPPGCLTVQGCLSAAPDSRDVVEALARVRGRNQAALERRLRRAVEDGDLPADADAAALARYLATVAQGISVQASAGASHQELQEVVRVALAALDGQLAVH